MKFDSMVQARVPRRLKLALRQESHRRCIQESALIRQVLAGALLNGAADRGAVGSQARTAASNAPATEPVAHLEG